jgi:hypothetical protein
MSEFVWEHGRVLGLDPVDWLVWASAVVGLGCIVCNAPADRLMCVWHFYASA